MVTFDILIVHQSPKMRLELRQLLSNRYGWKVRDDEDTQQASVRMVYEIPQLVVVSDLADTRMKPIEKFLEELKSPPHLIKSILIAHQAPIGRRADRVIPATASEVHREVLVAAEDLILGI